ncbi:MAG: tryptophan synthase subunit alpha [Halioglobus sp.]
MSRIEKRFQELANSGKKALIPYIVAGDPTVGITVPLMHALVGAGADIIELGVPFSDPMAEGPVIQLAHERALANKVSLRSALGFLQEFRKTDQETPVLLMGYANPVVHMGYASFTAAAAAADLDGLLTVDIPPEEVADLNVELQGAGIDNIFLVAPTTPDERVGLITGQASGFIYYVALKGVTGAGNLDAVDVASQVEAIRAHTALPIAVGFGIKDATSAAAVARVADGVVVGSALVQVVADSIEQGKGEEAAIDAAVTLLSSIRQGIDNAAS